MNKQKRFIIFLSNLPRTVAVFMQHNATDLTGTKLSKKIIVTPKLTAANL